MTMQQSPLLGRRVRVTIGLSEESEIEEAKARHEANLKLNGQGVRDVGMHGEVVAVYCDADRNMQASILFDHDSMIRDHYLEHLTVVTR